MPSPGAHVQIWGKGFRVSERSEEFQLLVPPSPHELTAHEKFLTQVDWGAVLPSLYKLDERARRQQFWLGLGSAWISLALVDGSKDRHRRRSVVLVAVTVEIDWRDVDLGWVIRRAAGVCRRYVRSSARTLEGAPDRLLQQLRDGTYLSDRFVELADETIDDALDWDAISTEVRRWRGISGIATRQLMSFGANVLYGERDDADDTVAGVLDPSTAAIEAVGSELSLWGHQRKAAGPVNEEAARPGPMEETLREIRDEQRELREQAERLERQQRRTNTLLESTLELASAWFDLWTGRKRH